MSITPLLLTIYLYSASKWWYQVFKNTTLTSRNVSTMVDVKCYVWRAKAALGYLTWPTHCWAASTSSNWCWRSLSKVGLGFMFRISQEDWVKLGSLGESPHPTPLSPDFTPWLSPPGVLHKLDHLRPSSRIVHNCIATDPILHGRTGTSGLPAAATCSWGRGIVHKTGIHDMPICQLH